MQVNFVDLKKQYVDISKRVGKEITKLISNSQFVGGSQLNDFERNFAEYNGTKHCVGVGSGTDALWLSLLALGIGSGDEVITTANTFVATALSIVHTGATPVFVDIDPNTYNIQPQKILSAITNKTKAIIPVHLYGQACSMDEIMEIANTHNLSVVEDVAQAVGAVWEKQKVGTFGITGCYSFYPTKNLGGIAQGGAVVTNNEEIADKVRSLCNVGRSKYSHTKFDYLGFNSRLDTINALFLNYILKNYLDEWTLLRQKNASIYNDKLRDVVEIVTPYAIDEGVHVYHLYQIKCMNKKMRTPLIRFLSNHNIYTGVYYPVPCHKQKILKQDKTLPITEILADSLLALPMHPYLTEKEINYVCICIKEFVHELF